MKDWEFFKLRHFLKLRIPVYLTCIMNMSLRLYVYIAVNTSSRYNQQFLIMLSQLFDYFFSVRFHTSLRFGAYIYDSNAL